MSIHTPSTPAATSAATIASTTPFVILTPLARPTSVPDTAHAVGQTTTLGQITRRAQQTPQTTDLRKLLDAFCQDGLMIVQTSRDTIYAGLSCDRFWDDRARAQFLIKQVAIVLEVTPARFRVLIETLDGAQAEFTVSGLWVR